MNTEVRTSIDTLLTTLKERLAQPGTSLLPLLNTMSRFSRYSLANQFLIFAQRPGATCVQGYRAWNKAGYQVRKGEHGIAIYAPMRFAQRDSDRSKTAPPLHRDSASASPTSSTSRRSTPSRAQTPRSSRRPRQRTHRTRTAPTSS